MLNSCDKSKQGDLLVVGEDSSQSSYIGTLVLAFVRTGGTQSWEVRRKCRRRAREPREQCQVCV